ncbi:WXG100 family type VII secretion target [Nocardia sp. NPDC050175]|uniref:WXG100 family type VII secretion target n=1 Tax=Nocardia sp. NPDC050175 TaxID=3364317 RepID=UPI0037878F4D
MATGADTGSGQSLSVVPEQVRAFGNYVYGLADTLRTALNSAESDVAGLTSDDGKTGTWTGDYAAEFGRGWLEVREGGGQIVSALATLAEKLGVTADSYQTVDESHAAALGMSSLDLP